MNDPSDIRLSEVNEALLLSSIRQHELTEQAGPALTKGLLR